MLKIMSSVKLIDSVTYLDLNHCLPFVYYLIICLNGRCVPSQACDLSAQLKKEKMKDSFKTVLFIIVSVK